MQERTREELDAQARELSSQGDFDGAATLAIKGYGPEIFTFLRAWHKDPDEADEVFARFAEGLWKSLSTFSWQSSLRTYAYAIARRISLHHRRDAHRRRKREAPMGEGSAISRIAAEVRDATAPILRSEVKSRIAELRAALPEEDQELLILRVNRGLSWLELAEVLRSEGAPPVDAETHKREAARLRKRFQLVKDKLREMARSEGLVDDAENER